MRNTVSAIFHTKFNKNKFERSYMHFDPTEQINNLFDTFDGVKLYSLG